VNAAGTWVEEPLIEASPGDIQRFVDTDVSGAILVTRACLPHLKASGSGRLIHLNGLQGFIRQRPPVLYAAVESAVRGLTESLRWEAADYGVHVGLISLGAVANTQAPTPAVTSLSDDGGRVSLSRDEVADAVIFMLSRAKGVNVDEIILTPLNRKP
jgi:ribitol 2-dehydrogenase